MMLLSPSPRSLVILMASLILLGLLPESSNAFSSTLKFDNRNTMIGNHGCDPSPSNNKDGTKGNENDMSKISGSSTSKQPIINDNSPCNSLDAFVQMRSGLQPSTPHGQYSNVVFWSADGELYESPSGKMLARIEGLECSHAVRLPKDDSEDVVRIFSRKLVWFLHPETYEIMTEWKGQPVRPIRYDAQVFDMKQGQVIGQLPVQPPASGDNNTSTLNSFGMVDVMLTPIQPYVVRSTRLVPCMPITPRWGGSQNLLMFQVPLFIDIEIPILPKKGEEQVDDDTKPKTRRYQAWEFYDYYLDLQQHPAEDGTTTTSSKEPIQQQASPPPPVLSWMRQGSTPPFCRDGNGVMHARGHRVERFEDLPQTTQEYVHENYPLFQGPPQDMEEVDELLGM